MISDPAALQYMFVKSGYRFPKQESRRIISIMVNGKGILWADGRVSLTRHKYEMICYSFYLKVISTNDSEK